MCPAVNKRYEFDISCVVDITCVVYTMRFNNKNVPTTQMHRPIPQ